MRITNIPAVQMETVTDYRPSQGRPRAGRYIGDCESKVYMQTRLRTAARFTSIGSVDVQHPSGMDVQAMT
jgi:hypothetical protein